MRAVDVREIEAAVARLCEQANFELPDDLVAALRLAADRERSARGREVLQLLDANQLLAREARIPSCQDTGFVLVFVELGQEVHLTGGSLEEAIQQGVRKGYAENYLRASIVADPLFDRANTGDNTPAVVHVEVVPGDRLKLSLLVKGAGSENSTQLGMLTPADGPEGVLRFVVETVAKAGPNACPPVVVAVGIGGTADKAMVLAKKASLRRLGESHPDPRVAAFEARLMEAVNATGIGPQGFGGAVTALAVHVETYPTHIASLPVAVNLQCHAVRHKEIVL